MRFSFVPRRLGHAAPLPLPAAARHRPGDRRARGRDSAPRSAAFERALIAAASPAGSGPSFTALRASHPAYCQLREAAPREIRAGASDESEMGAYHQLFQPQREANLRIRLEEYLRFGLEAGMFFET